MVAYINEWGGFDYEFIFKKRQKTTQYLMHDLEDKIIAAFFFIAISTVFTDLIQEECNGSLIS